MINFHDITIEGFGSISKPFTYVLGNSGINIISGKNGVGKTTIFSAICWCLYGKTLKDKNSIEPWIKPKQYNGTAVSIHFYKDKVSYQIIRCQDYTGKIPLHDGSQFVGGSKIHIIRDGVKKVIRDKRDTQAFIVELLGMSFELFKHSMVFGQKLTRFLQEKGPQQKEIFDEIFETSYLAVAKDRAGKKLKELDSEHDRLGAELISVKRQLNIQLSNIKNLVSQVKDNKHWVVKTKKEVQELSKKIQNIKPSKKIKYLQGRLSYYDSLIVKEKWDSDQQFKLELKKAQLEGSLKDQALQIKEITVALSKPVITCSKCGQPIKGDEVKKFISNQKNKRSKLLQEIKETKKSLEGTTQVLAKLESSKSNLTLIKKTREKVEKRLAALKNNQPPMDMLLSARLKAEGDLSSHVRALNATRLKLENQKKERKILKTQKTGFSEQLKKLTKELKGYRWLISDPLSNKGLKAYIFNSLITTINNRLSFYEFYIDYLIEFKIDLESANKNFEVTINQKGVERQYNDLSGGEQQLVDITLAFAIHDVTAKVKAMNILIMDEVFESLDQDNIEVISDLISAKAKNISIHLITHQQSITFPNISSTTHLVKKGGYTAAS